MPVNARQPLTDKVLDNQGYAVRSWRDYWDSLQSGINTGPIQSITGTLNRITVSAGINPVIDISSAYDALWQPIDADLTAIAALTGTGFAKRTGVNTWALDAAVVASVTGTADRITISGTATNPIIDIASTYIGQTSITTLGTITTGTWNGADIGSTYLPGDFSGFANPSTSIGLSVVNGSATTAMRSDGAPALSQSIVPTWSGVHTFTASGDGASSALQLVSAQPTVRLSASTAASQNREWFIKAKSTGTLSFSMTEDDYSSEADWLTVVRSGAVASTVTLTAASTFTITTTQNLISGVSFLSNTSTGALTFTGSTGGILFSHASNHQITTTNGDLLIQTGYSGIGDFSTITLNAQGDETGSILLQILDNTVVDIDNSTVTITGDATISGLGGTGTRLVTSTAAGVLGNATTIAGAYTWSGVATFSDNVAIGTANDAFAFYISAASITTGASQYGAVIDYVPTSAATSNSVALYLRARTPASTTTTDVYGAQIYTAEVGAGGAHTNVYGLYIYDQNTGATLNYALYTNAGLVRFGGAITASSTLDVTGTTQFANNVAIGTVNDAFAFYISAASITSGASQYGAVIDYVPTSEATSSSYALYVRARTPASTTTANVYGLNIYTAEVGAGGAHTNVYGLRIEDQNTGGTNYAIYTGSGLVRFGDAVTMAGTLGVTGVTTHNADVKLNTAGNGFYVKEGTNATMGSVTLVAGTATISTTKITAASFVAYSVITPGGTVGAHYTSARTAGTSFVVTSLNVLDTSVLRWWIVEPIA